MKLLQIDVCKNSGSTGKISEDIGRVAKGHNWESWKAYSRMHRDTQSSQSILIEVGTTIGFYISVVETRIFDNHCLGLSNIFSTKKLIKIIEEIKPDIIHLHDIKGYFLNIRTLFNYLSTIDIPVVWTMHSCWQITGHCGHFDHIKCERWKNGCYECPIKYGYPQSWLFDRSKRNWREKRDLFLSVKNMTMVPVSNWLAGFLDESILKGLPRLVIHNGIDTKEFTIQEDLSDIKSKYGLTEKFTILGVASPWTRLKGLDDFYKLRCLLSDELYQIILVGLSKKQIENLPEGIIGIQRTDSRSELASLYSFSDLFFNPTYEDNFPTVNIEALACGTPVATYRTGGSVEAVDQQTGFIIEQGDYAKMVDIISVVKQNGKKYYQQLCRDRATQLYDKDKCFLKYIELYNSLLSR